MTETTEITEKRHLYVELMIDPKTYDIDFAGVVSNIVYVRWLEDLRLEMLRQHLPLDELIEKGLAPTIVSTNIEYKYPVRIFNQVNCVMWISQLRNSSWVLQAEFVNMYTGKLAATATQKGVLLNTKLGRPGRVPKSLQNKYKESLETL